MDAGEGRHPILVDRFSLLTNLAGFNESDELAQGKTLSILSKLSRINFALLDVS